MADKRISQLVERTDIANNDVVPIVASGATTTNKATISSIQEFMQENLDLGVTSVGITLGTTGTDVSVSGSPITTSGNITINLPTASATNRGLLSSADWTTFNNKQPAGNYVTLDTAQTITAQKVFTTSGSSDTMIISHGSGSGFALDVIKAGNGEAIRVTKTSGSGNAMSITGGNFGAEAATFSGVVTTTPDAVINGVNVGRGGGNLVSNTRVGLTALQANTTGNQNTAFGTQVLLSNTTAAFNTGIGYNALLRNTTGGQNTAVGTQSLFENTIGGQNTATGAFSLHENTTGNSNTALGFYSLYSNTTGSTNIGVGSYSLYLNTTGTANTATGHSSLYSNTIGSYNTANGYYSLEKNTTGSNNTANGFQSLRENTIGASNTATGSYALENNTTGSENTAVGQNALEKNTTANGNTGIGLSALQNNTTGSSNTAAGRNALRSNTAGNSNTAFGWDALSTNTVSGANTAVGNQALRFSTGGENTAVGFLALFENTTGQNNTALGESALLRNTTGSNNIGIGNDSGSTTPSGQNTTGSNSIFIGGNTMGAANNQTNQIVIGHNAIGNGSNTVTLGNDSITNTYLKGAVTLTGALNGTSASFTGNVGIATAATISGADSLLLLTNTSTNGKSWRVESSSSGALFFTQVGVVNALQLAPSTGAATFSSSVNARNLELYRVDGGVGLEVNGGDLGSGSYIARFKDFSNNARVVITGNGRLGIGTVSPNVGLHVSGVNEASAFDITNTTASTGKTFRIASQSTGNLVFEDISAGTERMRITSEGELLINATSNSATSDDGSKFVSNGRLFQVSSFSDNTQESLSLYSTTASAYRFYVGWGGTIFATSPIISTISDVRVKENIRDLDSGLDKIMLLKPRIFDWKEGKGKDIKNDRGFIAQEFEEVFPDLIDIYKQELEEGEEPYKSVRADLIPTLVKAIQELKTEIDSLKNQIK